MKHKTWIELSRSAIRHNIAAFRKIIGPKVKLMAIVKSNAYGHGLFTFSECVKNQVDWFGVDSLREGANLRKAGIKTPILVLGYTLPHFYGEAEKNNISLTFYNVEEIRHLARFPKLKIHLKIDTGMHRQGVSVSDLERFFKKLGKGNQIEGIYTHFAAAKSHERRFKKYTHFQVDNFKKAVRMTEAFCGKKILAHASATAGTLNYPEARFDMVRIGIGMYGAYEGAGEKKLKLKPVLSWKTLVAGVKKVKKGSFVGYNLAHKVARDSNIILLPIGYWHGFDRGLSGVRGGNRAEVLVGRKKRRVIGIVSMDMVALHAPKNDRTRLGDEAVLIGKQGNNEIAASEIARNIDTVNYEVLTRINPLIYRKLTK